MKKQEKKNSLCPVSKIILSLGLAYAFVFGLVGVGRFDEPTQEQTRTLVQCKIDYCESLGYQSKYEPPTENSQYISWSEVIYCYDEYWVEKKIVLDDIWVMCGIELQKNKLRKFNLFCWMGSGCD